MLNAVIQALSQIGAGMTTSKPLIVRMYSIGYNPSRISVSRVNDLSGSVARNLSGRHSVPKEECDETVGGATGEPKDAIRRSV